MKELKSILISILCLFLFISDIWGYTERNLLQQTMSLTELENVLVYNQQWVTYPTYKNREGWQKLMGSNCKEYITRGEKQLKYNWQVITANDYLEFERSGSRAVMETPFNANCTVLVDLFMAELAEGKGRFMQQLINGSFYFCEMTSWALSAHLINQSTHRSLPNYNEELIDLTAGDMASVLSWIYYFFHHEFDKVEPTISKRIHHELERRIIEPYMNQSNFWWQAFELKKDGLVNNWNPWCNSNVLQCMLLIENDPKKLAKGVYRTMKSVDQFLNYVHADGACEEGPSYWGHAAGKLYDYLQILFDGTQGRISLFNHPMVRQMGEYIVRSYVGNGWVVNFADASAKNRGDAPLIYRFGKAVKSDAMMRFAALMNNRQLARNRDVYRSMKNLMVCEELETLQPELKNFDHTWYSETEFCYMQDSKGSFFSAKGGNNNESHNHNDAGTFSLYLNATPAFIDVGVGTYTRQTFSDERYSIWSMQSNYHNLPVINGVAQKNGSKYKATAVKFDAKKKSFEANIATAYPAGSNAKSWIRSYQLRNGELCIQDKFELITPQIPNRIHFMTWGTIDLSKAGIVNLTVKNERAELIYDANTFAVEIDTVHLSDPRLSNVWGGEVYRIALIARHLQAKGNYKYIIRNKSGRLSAQEKFIQENVDFAARQLEGALLLNAQADTQMSPITLNTDGTIHCGKYWDWRSGFFPGSLWYLYELTDDSAFANAACQYMRGVEKAKTLRWHHDIGFIINCSFGNGYRLKKDTAYAQILIEAAKSLSTRFREHPNVIQSWNVDSGWMSQKGWECPVIIDNMMNLELLFNATKLSKDSTYYHIAVKHADRTLKEHFRPDGSCYHVIDYNLKDGSVRNRHTAQGYAHESIWSRGQAWAIYGYTICYRETKQKKYLDQAIKTFKLMKNHPRMPKDLIPYWDMDAPDIPNAPRDVSAASCMASALYEMSLYDTTHARSYVDYADRIVQSLSSSAYRAKVGQNGNFLLMHSVGSIPHNSEIDVPLSYADYYYLEALWRKKNLIKNKFVR